MKMYLVSCIVAFLVFWPVVYSAAKKKGVIDPDKGSFYPAYAGILGVSLVLGAIWPVGAVALYLYLRDKGAPKEGQQGSS